MPSIRQTTLPLQTTALEVWPPRLVAAVRAAMDPTLSGDQWWAAFDELAAATDESSYDPQASRRVAMADVSTEPLLTSFLLQVKEALGELSDVYTDEVIEQAIRNVALLDNSDFRGAFNVRLLPLMNPSMPFDFLHDENPLYHLGDFFGAPELWAMTLRHNPMAPAMFPAHIESTLAASRDAEFQRLDDDLYLRLLEEDSEKPGLTRRYEPTMVKTVLAHPDLLERALVEAFSSSQDPFLGSLADVLQHRPETIEAMNIGWLHTQVERGQDPELMRFLFTMSQHIVAYRRGVRSGVLQDGVINFLTRAVKSVDHNIDEKRVYQLNGTANTLWFLQTYLRLAQGSPFPSLYEFLL